MMKITSSRRSFLMATAAGSGMEALSSSPAAEQAAGAAPLDTSYKGPAMTVQTYRGVPTLFVDGKPEVGRAYYSGRSAEAPIKAFGEAGVKFVSFMYTGMRGARGSQTHAWASRDVFDFSGFDDSVNTILKANPAARIFPRVDLNAPNWWLDENPGEVMVYWDGTTLKPLRGGRAALIPAWSSKKWREDTALYLRKLIEHVATQPYAPHVVGYHLSSGGTQEWYYATNWRWFFFGVNEDLLDYSKHQTEAFRAYLRAKYGSVEGLRAAWRNNTVTFETAEIAPKAAKMKPDWGVFFDPAKSQQVYDSFDLESDVVADTIAYFCKVVKDATGGKAMTGAFYGYVTGAPDKGYLSTHKLLQSPYIDFLCAPSDYDFREPGAGLSAYRTVARSVQLHQKLWWDENDYYTYLTPASSYVEGWTGPRDYASTETSHIRQLCNQIANASPAWWFDWGSFGSPEAIELIGKLNAIAERSLHADRGSVAEIAAVVDEKSLHWLEIGWSLYRPLIQEQRMPMGRIGAPVDWILMDDLDEAPAYKMYVFLSAFRVTEPQMKSIERLYSRGAKAVVWVYAPGILGDAIDGKNSFAATGMKLKLLFDRTSLHVEMGPDGAKSLPGVQQGWRYGTDAVAGNSTSNKIGPIMVGDDPAAATLGVLYGVGEPGLIEKTVNGAQAYFSSAPKLPDWLLRGIAAKAGVHIYNAQDDALYVNKSFLGIHTPTAGKRTIHFPAPVSVYDTYKRKTIAHAVTQVTLDLPARYSGLFFLGTEQEWNAP
jgi:beta-galactosidase